MEIEDRGIIYKSYMSYSKALQHEIRLLQQLLPQEKIGRAFEAVKKEIKSGKITAVITEE